MAFCINCGEELAEGAKFCANCGKAVGESNINSQRKSVYEGEIHKCPNCGEVLKSLELNCPSCGYEIRGIKALSSVREFALKLENIEASREYEKTHGMLKSLLNQQRVSKADEQKISLIKSFSVPNTKEDMLEFMILATSSMNMSVYDSSNTNISKSDKEINAAWFAKVQQVYEKAKRSYSADGVFREIKSLYDDCNDRIKKSKKKGVLKWVLLLGWMPILFGVIFIWAAIYSPIDEKKEVARLEAVVTEIERQLEAGEYKYALMNADTLVYSGSIRNDEQSHKWKIEREYWIDKVIDEAAKAGVILERPIEETVEEDDNLEVDSGGFVEGVKEGMQPSIDEAKEKIDEFNQILSKENDLPKDENDN